MQAAAQGQEQEKAAPQVKERRWELWVGLLILAAVIARAWICDDAAITARSVDNLLHGYGLRWNVAERVAPFTHPLWALLQIIPTAVVGWYAALIGLGIACTAVTLWILLVRIEAPTSLRVVVAAGLGCSFAFLDFSTSGLENSLTNALLVGVVAALPGSREPKGRLIVLVLAGLLTLNRLDSILLIAPVVTVLLLQARRDGASIGSLAKTIALAWSPLLAWEAFSLVYYGFLLPNTAYAKLSTAIPLRARLGNGLDYLVFTLLRDPVTLLGQAGFVVVLLRRGRAWDRTIAAGVILYDLYVLWIGGDFMAGRFWVAPLVLGAAGVLVEERRGPSRRVAVMLVVAMMLAAASGRLVAARAEPDYTSVVDERAAYAEHTGLLHAGRPEFRHHPWLEKGRQWREQGPPERGVHHGHAVGFLGLEAGPEIFIVDRLGLTDPLVARLPAAWEADGWRPGHFERMGLWSHPVKPGARCPSRFETCRFWRQYDRSLRTGTCHLDDPELCTYWEQLRLITRGELWSAERWQAIVAHNLGLRSRLVDTERYQMAAQRDLGAGR
jgi:arabinofuranosyltransferase